MYVKPRDCAIAVCLPLDSDAFIRALTSGEEGTFVRENLGSASGPFKYLTPLQLWARYQPLASLIENVLRHVERLGVRTIRNATLTDFYELCATSPVVSLFAHWRSARFRRDDFVDEAALIHVLRSDTRLRDMLIEMGAAVRTDEELGGEQALLLLNQALDADRSDPSDGTAGKLTARQVQWYRRRAAMESIAPDLFRQGAAVEFSDGLKTIAAVLAGLPEQTPRWLDLTVCNSVLLAQALHDARPSTHCLCNEQNAIPEIRIALYRQVIDRLHRKNTTFEDACFDVRSSMKGFA